MKNEGERRRSRHGKVVAMKVIDVEQNENADRKIGGEEGRVLQ